MTTPAKWTPAEPAPDDGAARAARAATYEELQDAVLLLAAERDAARAEVERLREERDVAEADLDSARDERDAARAALARLDDRDGMARMIRDTRDDESSVSDRDRLVADAVIAFIQGGSDA